MGRNTMDEAYRQAYYDLERSHWWFRAREAILKSYLSTNLKFSDQKSLRILNLGAATGRSSQMLTTFGEVDSVEPDKGNCEFLRQTLNLKAYHASATSLPFDTDTYDLVCAFDVIEHIEDVKAAIREIKRVLKPGGSVLITVPAFNFLWSPHDEVNQHYRRYTKKGLVKLMNPYFNPVYCGYFNFFLFPAIMAYRMLSKISLKKSNASNPKSDFSVSNPTMSNKAFFHLFCFERHFLRQKIQLPFGVSLIYEGRVL